MSADALRQKIAGLLGAWETGGAPSSSEHLGIAADLLQWRHAAGIPGLWARPPLMVTATLDDGWGNGLTPVHRYAEALGVRVVQLGLMRPVAEIVAACRRHRPDMLGLTVLQFDSLEDLEEIAAAARGSRVIAGGPIFKRTGNADWRARGWYAAGDVRAFLNFALMELPTTG